VAVVRKSDEQGHAQAQFNLGVCYYNGEGVRKDAEKAAEWYRKAAEQGYAAAQFALSACYNSGEGVPRDMGQAVVWLRKAAEQGHAKAQRVLLRLRLPEGAAGEGQRGGGGGASGGGLCGVCGGGSIRDDGGSGGGDCGDRSGSDSGGKKRGGREREASSEQKQRTTGWAMARWCRLLLRETEVGEGGQGAGGGLIPAFSVLNNRGILRCVRGKFHDRGILRCVLRSTIEAASSTCGFDTRPAPSKMHIRYASAGYTLFCSRNFGHVLVLVAVIRFTFTSLPPDQGAR
jgi:hypothetical protein